MSSEEDPLSSEEEEEEEEEEITTLENSDVVTKYQEAAKIVNLTMKGLTLKCTAGADVVSICLFGDTLITKQCQRIFKSNKELEKGIAFPTCISVNNVVCHCSPLQEDSFPLAEGDVVKIDVGAHIDGYIATAAHTLVVGANPENPVTGRTADLLAATAVAQDVAHRLVVNGKTNAEVTAALKQVAADFGVSLVQGVLSHEMKRFVIDGNKVILEREEVDQKVAETTFNTFEVYAVDIVMSTGEGKPRASDNRTTVFKRALDVKYSLKLKTSRALFQQVQAKFDTLPFTLRSIENVTKAKAGVVECVKRGLLTPYPVLVEREGEQVAHAKMTVLLMPSGTSKITGLDFQQVPIETEKVPGEETQKILALRAGKKKRRKKKKKKAGPTA